jgi:hypothetical protein
MMDMKTLTIGAALGLGLALSACGDVSSSNAGNPAINIANPGSDRLRAASPTDQRIAMMHAIRDDGQRCRRVDALGYQQQYRESAMWVALCDDGRHWAVFIAPTEAIQVRACAQSAQLGLPACRPVPRVPHDPSAPPGSDVPANEVEAANRNLTNAQ